MLKSHERFHSYSGKRLVLVADDELINRELLNAILQDDYDVLLAEDGGEAYRIMREHGDTLSLVLLDLRMPVMSGVQLLKTVKDDPILKRIPIIVVTADHDAEVESLGDGAIDFISKPYPAAAVILARIRRTIELNEDQQIIKYTERDPVTGLYNRDYFFRYAQQLDIYHKEQSMDAVVVDINHFHIINERFGTAYGDELLHRIGEALRKQVSERGGIVCRREADTFLVYCPHLTNQRELLECASVVLERDDGMNVRVRLRMGVYPDVDKSIDIQRRFDRAKMAADTVRNSYTNAIGSYDKTLHDRELYSEQLVDDFRAAIMENQFRVFYQPKFDVRGETPLLTGAEALVRWYHPRLGLVSPGAFIPLFEENGLIQILDECVWRQAAAHIRDWKKRLGFCVPISVNVSRIDMYDPKLIDRLCGILRDNDLKCSEMILEITESAYTENSEQIIDTVTKLRELGFKIEMDDFGTGYSSLNMISSLPIDAMKLDMGFIRSAFNDRHDTRMLEVMIDIADYLDVPVIAEGVETEEQVMTLKAIGCDIVQGFYFSRPIPQSEFEKFIVTRIEQGEQTPIRPRSSRRTHERREHTFGLTGHNIHADMECVYYVDTVTNKYMEITTSGAFERLNMELGGRNFFEECRDNITSSVYPDDQQRMAAAFDKNSMLQAIGKNGAFSSAYRLVVDGKPVYYRIKASHAGPSDQGHIFVAVTNIDRRFTEELARSAEPNLTYTSIAQALAEDYFSIYYVDIKTDKFIEYSSNGEYLDLGIEKQGDDFFELCRKNIRRVGYAEDIDNFLAEFTKENIMEGLAQRGSFTLTYRLVMEGVPTYVHLKATPMRGDNGDHIVIGISNVDAQIKREQELFTARQVANRDALTGVRSKYAFVEAEREWNDRLNNGEVCNFAVVVCDVNDLKRVNDNQGHKEGDKLLKKACMILSLTFRHSSVFRVGGDEFAVILSGHDYENRHLLYSILLETNEKNYAENRVSMACGMGEYEPSIDRRFESVFKRADAAMYEHKKSMKGLK